MPCIRSVSFQMVPHGGMRHADLRKSDSCSMSHSRASDILRHRLASAYLKAAGYFGNGVWKG